MSYKPLLTKPAFFPIFCLLCGLLGGFSLAPFSITALSWLILIPLVAASNFESAKLRLFCGYSFGIGYGLSILTWVPGTVAGFSGLNWGLSGLVSLWFVIYSAIAPAIACWLPYRLSKSLSIRLLLILPLCWAGIMELLVEAFIGVPNLTLGMAQVDGPLRGIIPIAGEWGASIVVMLLNVLVFLLFRAKATKHKVFNAIAIVTLFASVSYLDSLQWTLPQGKAIDVALVQGDFDLKLQSKSNQRSTSIERYIALSKTVQHSDLVLWPETALPLGAEASTDFQTFIGGLQEQQSTLLTGTWEQARGGRYYNSIRTYGDAAEQRYRKRLLVPFAEKTPFAALTGSTATDQLIEGRNRSNLAAAGIEIGTSICWELLFRRLIVSTVEQGAELLVNLADDSWADDSVMFSRNLQIARFRALESGRPLIRVATSGTSAAIDHKGRMLQQLPTHQQAAARLTVQPQSQLTPAVAIGQSSFLLASALLMLAIVVLSRDQKSPLLQRDPLKPAAGFTIIELITVIALLGILSAVALPRFMNITETAEQARFDAVKGSFATAAKMVHDLSVSRGSRGSYPNITLDGGLVVVDPNTGWPNVFQANTNCADVASIPGNLSEQLLVWAQLPARFMLEGLLGIRPAWAAGSVPVGENNPLCGLPELLLEGNYGDWSWDWNAVSRSADFIDPQGRSFTYDQDDGVLP